MDFKRKTIKTYTIRIISMLIISALIILVAFKLKPEDETSHGQFQIKYDLTLWYYDESLTPYLNSINDAFFKVSGLRVQPELVPSLEFFDNINKKNIEGEGAPDLYIIDSSKLENAYLSSLAKPVDDDEISGDIFLKKALDAATYKERLVAYPLCFDTSFLAYNSDKIKNDIAYLDDIANGDNSFEMDVSNLLYSYVFIGEYADLGGPSGDDASSFDLSSPDYTEALEFMRDFSQKKKIDPNILDYRTMEKNFIQGDTDAAIFSTVSLTKLYGAGIDFKIQAVPDMNENLISRPLSQTSVICVNPGSLNAGEAEMLAHFMTIENTGDIFEKYNLVSCKKADQDQDNDDLTLIKEIYEGSASLPKLIETENIWENLNILLTSVWEGTDIERAQSKLNVAIYVALSTRTEQEDK